MMAWMLGVAGARQMIKRERYRWVAPASAFFRSNVQPVTLGSWPTALPPGRVVVERAPGAKTRFTPDYLVLRLTAANRREWGVVEAKGSKRALALRHVCPPDWKKQVRNVRVTVDEKPVRFHGTSSLRRACTKREEGRHAAPSDQSLEQCSESGSRVR